jgi:hypothetical protein
MAWFKQYVLSKYLKFQAFMSEIRVDYSLTLIYICQGFDH